MSKYNPGDDGKTIDGKIVVWINPPVADSGSGFHEETAPAASDGYWPSSRLAAKPAVIRGAAMVGFVRTESARAARPEIAAVLGANECRCSCSSKS